MPRYDHELKDPLERKAAADFLRLFRRAPGIARDRIKYELARLAQDRRRKIKIVSNDYKPEDTCAADRLNQTLKSDLATTKE